MPAAGGEGKSLRLPHVCAGAGTVGRKQLWGWDPPRFPFSPFLGAGGGDVWGCPYVGCSLHLQAKRKLDLEGPELCTPKGKGRTLAQVPSPRSKFGALERDGRWGVGGVAGWEGGAEPISQSCAVSPPALPEVTPGSSAHCSFVCCFSSVHGRRAPGVMGGGVHLGYFSTS